MIGIIQGRLTKTPINILQKFPKKWALEFPLAKECGFNYIEFFSERNFNKQNPVWSKINILKYLELANNNNLKIYSFVDDYVIYNPIFIKKNYEYLKKLIINLNLINIKKLVLPFYEKNEITEKNVEKFIPNLSKIANFATKKKINILLEGNFNPELFFYIKKKCKTNKIGLVFDSGNRVNLNRNIYNDIEIFKDDIKHIHIKDKNDKNKNVKLGSGNLDFIKFFRQLKKIKYNYNFAMESTRENDPIKTAKKNLKFIQKQLKFNKF